MEMGVFGSGIPGGEDRNQKEASESEDEDIEEQNEEEGEEETKEEEKSDVTKDEHPVPGWKMVMFIVVSIRCCLYFVQSLLARQMTV